MAQPDGSLSDENVHVKELKRLFITSGVDKNGFLNREGLHILCEKLNLNEFSASIVERVLSHEVAVNFKQFKDRFLTFLPEIIDLASGNADNLLVASYKTCTTLGFNDTQRLTKYELRVVCEGTPSLNLLTVADINSIFNKIAKQSRCSLSDFIAQYRNGQKPNTEVHFIGDAYRISPINLFEQMESSQSDEIERTSLMEFLTSCGLKIEDSVELVKGFDDENIPAISLSVFSRYLETSLATTVNSSPLPVKAAIFCLHSLVENLRCNIKEYELRCEHMQKQLQVANQRRTLLIEELDQNQQSIEASYNNRLREMEDRCRQKIALMEEKFRMERQEVQLELESIENDLSRVRHNETFLKNKLCVLERHNKRLTNELEEQIAASNNMEQKNRELRTELNKKVSFRNSEDSSRLVMWKQKVELLVDHNKKLRERMEEMQKTHKRNEEENDQAFLQWTPPFRSQLMLIRKRRMQRGDTLSELESEPESIFYRRRRKRLIKKKDRRNVYEKIHNLQSIKAQSSTSPSDKMKRTISSYSRVGELGTSEQRVLTTRNKESTRKQTVNQSPVFPLLNNCKSEVKSLQNSLKNKTQEDSGQNDDPTAKFLSLIDKYRRVPEVSSTDGDPTLGVEKKKSAYSKTASSCVRCSISELKINELMSILDGKRKEGSVEDPMPNRVTQSDNSLTEEVGRLKLKMVQALAKAAEMKTIVSTPQTSSRLHPNNMNHFVTLTAPTRLSPRSFADFHRTEGDPVQDPAQTSNVYRFS